MVIFLVGFMGSGKNWWGCTLAERLNIPFVDLDNEIEKTIGMEIVSIFEEKGEAFFRDIETQVLKSQYEHLAGKVAPFDSQDKSINAIIATGGGTPCFGNNMQWMNQQGLTVWLNPSVPELVRRLEKETEKRPLLKGKTIEDITSFIDKKLAERNPFYNLAKIEIKNTHIAVEEFINLLHNASDIH